MPPFSGFRLGRILGIEIVINVTWLVIFFLVAFTFGSLFRETTFRDQPFPGGAWPWVAGLLTALVFFACLILHELSHGIVARRNGVEINRITLFIFGGVAEMSEDVKSAGTEFKMAVAGPLVTFFLAGVFYLLYRLSANLEAGTLIVAPLFALFWVNLLIGCFNLLPGFPLDGGRVLRSIIWKFTGDLLKSTRIASVSGQAVAALIGLGGAYLLIRGDWIGGAWLIIVGMFLYRLAQVSYRQTLFRIAASDTVVADIMYTDVPSIEANTPLTSVKHSFFAAYRLPAFPVTDHGELTGIIERDTLDSVYLAEWDVLDAGRLGRPLSSLNPVTPDTPLDRIIRRLMGREEFLVVVEKGKVVGILTREELVRYVEMRLRMIRHKQGPGGGPWK